MNGSQVFQTRIFLLKSLVIWSQLLAPSNLVSLVLMTSLFTGLVTPVARNQMLRTKTCHSTDQAIFNLFLVMVVQATWTIPSLSGQVPVQELARDSLPQCQRLFYPVSDRMSPNCCFLAIFHLPPPNFSQSHFFSCPIPKRQ